MPVHHLAIVTTDLEASHRFYTEAMGFTLAKVEVGPYEGGTGWARHVFYEIPGGGMFALWDLHDESVPADLDPSISRALGLPEWTNHLAFDAPTLEDLAVRRDRWLAAGQACLEVDHGWCTSIYCLDPNHILVEWCTSTREFTDADRAEALELLTAESPAPTAPKGITLHTPDGVSQPMPTA